MGIRPTLRLFSLRREKSISRAFCQPLNLRRHPLLTLLYRNFSAVSCRCEATGSAPSHQQAHDKDSLTQGPVQPPRETQARRRYWRTFLYSAFFLCVGIGSGLVVSAVLVPPPLPAADTDENELLLSTLRKDLGDLQIVKELRSRRDEWLEYEAYMSQPLEAKASSMSAGAMRGFGGLGIQRIFWNKEEKRLINVVFFGGALAGWPGVVHGGAVATVLQENLERVVNGPEFGSGLDSVDAMMLKDFRVEYRKPTQANAMYVVKAEVEEVQEPGLDSQHRKAKATLEGALDGNLRAKASGRCVPRYI